MKRKLIKLIEENPELDVVTMVCTDELTDEYGYLLQNIFKVEVSEIYESPDKEHLYFDKEDIIDELGDFLADDEKYFGMNQKDYDNICKEKAKDYFIKKAIVIWTRG